MNEDQFKQEVKRRWGRRSEKGRVWAGLFFLLIGALLFAKTAGIVVFPYWFFTWPMILIAVGLFTGVRHGFRSPAPFILMLIGGIFLMDRINDDVNLKPYFWPIVFVAGGLFIILRPRGRHCRRYRDEKINSETPFTSPPINEETKPAWEATADQNDVIDITAVFGGVKKKVLSKNFKGGDIVAVMGGTEINLSQADFNGRVAIDIFTMFGGTKLIVPNDWDVQSQVVAIFGGVDDKRPPATNYDPSKVIYLEGTCIFGGIEIRNF
jgi:predicted membrane protein